MFNRKVIAVLAVAAFTSGFSVAASAETAWQKAHPARAEINHRLAHQDQRIDKEVREGEISHRQALNLHRKDHQIRREERAVARRHHGHLTGAEARAINRQENAVSKQIGH
jgi:hypothetical protein